MRNLILVLVAILAVLLGVFLVRQFSAGAKDTAPAEKVADTASTLPSAAEEKKAVEASASEEKKQAVPAVAKTDEAKGRKNALIEAADRIASQGDREKAARAYGKLLEDFASKPNPWADRAAEIEEVREKHAAAVRDLLFNPAGDWKSAKVTVASGDNLTKISKKAAEASTGKPVTVGMILKANRLAKDTIHPGQVLRVPQEAMKVVVDRASYSLRVYFGDLLIGFHRVGLGQPETPTPTGSFVVAEKQKNPTWFPKGEAPIPFGDPKNPLGARWISLRQNGAPTGYGIHGTNDDKAVGASISQGCVRMFNKEVEELFEILPEGTAVEIR